MIKICFFYCMEEQNKMSSTPPHTNINVMKCTTFFFLMWIPTCKLCSTINRLYYTPIIMKRHNYYYCKLFAKCRCRMLGKAKNAPILDMRVCVCVCVEVGWGGIPRQCQCTQAYNITRCLFGSYCIHLCKYYYIAFKNNTLILNTHSLLQSNLLAIIPLPTVTQFQKEWMTEYKENKEW